MAGMQKVAQGMEFNAGIADAMPLFIVTKSRGNGVWDCVVEESDPEYAGTSRVFDEKEIISRVALSNMFKTIGQDHESWWNSQSVGSVIHYHNGFNQFVRCSIVEVGGEMQALPFALVGSWRQHDLPQYDAFGDLREGYHVRKIRSQEPFQPNFTNVYEASKDLQKRTETNPAQMQPIDLSLPELSQQQVRINDLNKIRLDLISLLSAVNSNDGDINATLVATLAQAKEKLCSI